MADIPTIIKTARALGPPLAFDFFCGGGGASMGLLTVIGVDKKPEMLRAHFSPPCQDFSSLKNVTGKSYASGRLLFEVLELAPKLAMGMKWGHQMTLA
jgi:hypothetical protein